MTPCSVLIKTTAASNRSKSVDWHQPLPTYAAVFCRSKYRPMYVTVQHLSTFYREVQKWGMARLLLTKNSKTGLFIYFILFTFVCLLFCLFTYLFVYLFIYLSRSVPKIIQIEQGFLTNDVNDETKLPHFFGTPYILSILCCCVTDSHKQTTHAVISRWWWPPGSVAWPGVCVTRGTASVFTKSNRSHINFYVNIINWR